MISGVMQDRALFGVRVLDLSQLHGYASKLFADLGADELQRISGLCKTRQLAAGEKLFRKGDSGDALYGIRRRVN